MSEVQLPHDWFRAPKWPPFQCFGTKLLAKWPQEKLRTIYAYAKFWGNKQRALWYVMIFSVVVNF